ncbi:MAG: tRNA 2-thiouridine(34) synthase MnmA [Gammaproteobacteria bacterium]|nr:tRNA 2-thiouridine(34) synthase MnmA [Gammaproteobacteria bacterium]
MADLVIVALSGGVDSAVAAWLLRRAGRPVEGLFMANWDASDDDRYCTLARDFQDARSVARELGIVLHKVNFAAQYRATVFESFLAELRAGRTPNPDVWCNREIKFGLCLQYARRLGARRLATGHYARLSGSGADVELHKGADPNKDQSYFLHAVPRAQLAAAEFPLGELTKEAVRELARRAGLPVHDKPDSTGICFIGERPFGEFVSRWLAQAPGPIVDAAGRRLGTHRGLAYYTIGQRSGLGLGGRSGAITAPWFVAGKDPAANRLIVVQGHDHPLLYSRGCSVRGWHWLVDDPPAGAQVQVKLRYRQADQVATLSALRDDAGVLEFAVPQRAVTPGQFAVLYRGSRCLGGGVIEAPLPLAASADDIAIIRGARAAPAAWENR